MFRARSCSAFAAAALLLLSAAMTAAAPGFTTHSVSEHDPDHFSNGNLWSFEKLDKSFAAFIGRAHEIQSFQVPVRVRVALLGLEGQLDSSGNFLAQWGLDAKAFEEALMAEIPNHVPSCVETKEPLHLRYAINYEVQQLPSAEILLYEQELRRAMSKSVRDGVPSSLEAIDVDAVQLESYYDSLMRKYYSMDMSQASMAQKEGKVSHIEYTMFILSPDRINALPTSLPENLKRTVTYRLRYGAGNNPTSTFVSSKNYLVVDLGSGPVEYGSMDETEGSVLSSQAFPRLFRVNPANLPDKRNAGFGAPLLPKHPERGTGTNVSPTTHSLAKHQLIEVVRSAIEHVWLPDLRWRDIPYAEKILIPIFVFRNHFEYNSLHKTFVPSTVSSVEHNTRTDMGLDAVDELEPFQINLKRIRAAISKMLLPGQEAMFVSGLHGLDEHPQISMAVDRSIRSRTEHTFDHTTGEHVATVKHFLQGALLENALRESGDLLTAGILEESDLTSTFKPFSSDTATVSGTRILPVYVFSLHTDTYARDDALLFEHSSPVWASHSSVLVLQTDETLEVPLDSYTAGSERPVLTGHQATRSIISGLAEALGGLTSPLASYSVDHERSVPSYMWSSGYHPWGPWSNTTGLSEVWQANARRNIILAGLERSQHILQGCMEKLLRFARVHLNYRERVASLVSMGEWNRLFKEMTGSTVFEDIHKKLGKMFKMYSEARGLLVEMNMDSVSQMNNIVAASSKFEHFLDDELAHIKDDMQCCWVQYRAEKGWMAFLGGPILLSYSLFAIVSLCLLYWLLFARFNKRSLRPISLKSK